MGETAVVINEFGETGLDHLLVEKADDDTVLLSSGCLCCTVRGDLIDALRRLFRRRHKGEIPAFRRVVIETTGLADPAPILHTLMQDPVLTAVYRLDGIITTVDAVNGETQLDRQMESVNQAAVADRILLTKCDLADADAIAAAAPGSRVLPKLGLTAIAGWIAHAERVIGVDTGLMHLAAALATPGLSLYGPTLPQITGAFGRNQVWLCNADAPTTIDRARPLTVTVARVIEALSAMPPPPTR